MHQIVAVYTSRCVVVTDVIQLLIIVSIKSLWLDCDCMQIFLVIMDILYFIELHCMLYAYV